MGWLTDLLKHLAISRTVTGAMFFSALAMYFGPKFFPASVDPVPKEWSFVVVGAMVFSGSLLTFWTIAAVWRLIAQSAGTASKALAATSLSQRELELLGAMGMDPNQPLSIDNVDYTKAPFSKLELIELTHELSRKGLVDLNPYDNSLVSLSPRGRKRALEIHRQARGSDAA